MSKKRLRAQGVKPDKSDALCLEPCALSLMPFIVFYVRMIGQVPHV